MRCSSFAHGHAQSRTFGNLRQSRRLLRKKAPSGNVMHYATHTLTHENLGYVVSVVIELCVDRARGTTVDKQWCQPPDSVMITGVYTHFLPINRLFEKGFRGWFRLHQSVYATLKRLSIRNGEPYLEPPGENSSDESLA